MSAGDPRRYYELLGIDRTASAEEIRTAFRERAKRYHPDGGARGDEARFHRLREAFETLRDPQRRMRYDAEGLRAEQEPEQPAAGAGAPADDPDAAPRPWADAAALRASLQAGLRQAWPPAALVLGLVLLLAGLAWYRLAAQDRAIAALTQRLDGLQALVAERARPAAEPAREPGQPAVPLKVRFQGELVFPRGLAELAAANRTRADQVMHGLKVALANLPPGGNWTVLLLAGARRLGGPDDGAAASWELAVRRLGAAGDYLVRQGVPAERIAARFQAGADGADATSFQPEALQLQLLCCAPAIFQPDPAR